MSGMRLIRFWPGTLRWRLVVGFVLSVVVLQAALVVSERVLLRQTLVQSTKASMLTSVKTGIRTVLLPVRKKMMNANVLDLKQPNTELTVAAANTLELPSLASALTLPDQPVILLSGNGHVFLEAGTLAGDRTRTHHVAPAVLRTLSQVATGQVRGLTAPRSEEVSTPDGPYLMVLVPVSARVLLEPIQKQRLASILRVQKQAGFRPGGAISGMSLSTTRTSHLFVAVAHRLGDIDDTVRTVTIITLVGTGIVILLAGLLSMLVVGRSLRPLTAITQGAERLAEGDYGHQVVVPAIADEVGRLGDAFNRMAQAIGAAFSTQRRFVADASHEIRTPLTALRGYTDVLLLGVGEDPATSQRILHAMQEDLTRMSRLVNDLLTLARLDASPALQIARVDLRDLLVHAVDEGKALSHGNHTLLLEPNPPPLAIQADRDRLRQVLTNLVANACAYCPSGSTIAIGAQREVGGLLIVVRDNGPGIPEADLARLGERFYRGDAARSRDTGGMGLGLAIARAIVQAHGGSMAIESASGARTTVTIRLPYTATAGNASPSPSTRGTVAQ